MTYEEFLLAIDALRHMGYDPQPREFHCMVDAADEGAAVGAYLLEYGGGDWREEALTAAERNI